MEKFNLSSKILTIQSCGNNPCILESDVKEFIKLSRQNKNELFKKIENGVIFKKDWDMFMIKEDKLAGDKLNGRV